MSAVAGRPIRARAAALARALLLSAGAARLAAQAAPLPLGEGVPQPDGRPVAIPGVAPRRQPTTAPWSVRFARSVMARNPRTHRRWDYTAGLVLYAIERAGRVHRDTAMLAYVRRNIDTFVAPDGAIGGGYARADYNLDAIAPGRVLLALHQRTRAPRYRLAAAALHEQLRTHPRTPEGGLWHKQVYPEQMWLDGLYMAQPFRAAYAQSLAPAAERASLHDDIARQFLLIARHTRVPATRLLVHGWDAARQQRWADSLTGRAPTVWARAMGWFVMGLVETLDDLPAAHPDRPALLAVLQDAADGIARVQDPLTGLWWDIPDAPDHPANYLEASASAMFAFALAKGARLGHLEPRFRRLAERAFDGITTNLVRPAPYGVSLVNVCQVSGLGGAPRRDGSYRDGSVAYYLSEPVVADDYKGVGPLILAALELGR